MDIYTNGDNDQPVECPECGSRTDFVPVFVMDNPELHTCLGCDYRFIMEYDDESM